MHKRRFGPEINNTFGTLDDKLLEAGKHADELRNDHIGALRKELQLLDHESLDQLVKNLDTVAKSADGVFEKLQGHWYTFGIGSAGASHALEQFKTNYDNLISQNKDKEAGDLLAGTLGSAKKILAAQKEVAKGSGGTHSDEDWAQRLKYMAAGEVLKKAGVSATEKELASQEALVKALEAQVGAQGKIAQLKALEGANAKTTVGNEASGRESQARMQAIASQLAIAEQVLAGDRAMENARMTIARASVETRLQSDLGFAQRETDIKTEANRKTLAALDKASGDYANQVRDTNNKALELAQAHETQVKELRAKASVDQAARDLSLLEAGEKENIAATREGSQARIDAIDEAMAEARTKQLQDTDYYRQMGTDRVNVVRQLAEDEAQARADAGREEADNIAKLGQLALAAELQKQMVLDAARRMTDEMRLAEAMHTEQREYAIKEAALQYQIDALDRNGKNYENKLKALQNKELQLTREHENAVSAIRDRAALQRQENERTALASMAHNYSSVFMQILGGHQTFASMMSKATETLASNLVSAGIDMAAHLGSHKMDQAKDAARWGFNWGAQYGGPLAPVLAPAMAATFFTGVMAFAGGTDAVPGVGRGDVVPTMLTPGEGVVPNGVMDGLRKLVQTGGLNQQPGMTIHPTFAPTIHALDSDGVDKVLDKHGKKFQAHFEKTLRKMNRN